jgi:DAACS family dicarboxylate/amino acid:cation (Na+ or H+) symporter
VSTDRRRVRIPFFVRIIAAMVMGALVGLSLGKLANPLGQLGSVIIGMIKALAGPLLLFAVIDAFLRTHVRLRSGARMIAISLTNAVIAVVIGLTLSNMLRPGDHLDIPTPAAGKQVKGEAVPGVRKIDFVKELTSYIPTSVVQPFLDNSVISIIILAVLAGASLRHVKNEQEERSEHGYKVVEDGVAIIYRTIEVMLGAVITLVPWPSSGLSRRRSGTMGSGRSSGRRPMSEWPCSGWRSWSSWSTRRGSSWSHGCRCERSGPEHATRWSTGSQKNNVR